MPQPVIIVAGPTASGKSALAMQLAQRLHGTVINADSMQIYAELRLITARPGPEDEASVPHALYGVRPAAMPGNTAWWRAAAIETMAAVRAAGRLPILCGGTGLYFLALTDGLAEIPDPGAAARDEARGLLTGLGPAGLHARLASADPETAARLRPQDSQRIARAWEVWRGTGRGLAWWQRQPGLPPVPDRFAAVVLDPPRPALRAAIAARFDAMVAAGAVEEVQALLAQDLDPALPSMRAHGVPELAAYLRNQIPLAEAMARAVQATGRYTKRQATWLRHHRLADPHHTHTINAENGQYTQFMESIMPRMENFIQSCA